MNLLTYSDDNYEKERNIHLKLSNKYNYNYISKTKKDLINTDFYSSNKKILNCLRGAGFWLWKPYFILETLLTLDVNDYLIYVDAGDILMNSVKYYLDSEMINKDFILLPGVNKNSKYTKRDCFILMNCDEEKYWNGIQIEAGFSIWKKTDFSIKILNEWISYCKNWDIISDDINKYGQNFDDFIDHRHDQSILTNLYIKYNLFTDLYLRNFIEYNYKYYHFDPSSYDSSKQINNFLFENKDIIYE